MLYTKNLKTLREENNLTQQNIADMLGIERGAYSLYETEYIIIPIKHLIFLCNYFHVSLDFMFDFTNEVQHTSINLDVDKIKSGVRLKELRKSLKLTQDKLAQKLNVARSIISEYEKGNYLISTHSLYTLCKSYGVSADYLMGRIDSK